MPRQATSIKGINSHCQMEEEILEDLPCLTRIHVNATFTKINALSRATNNNGIMGYTFHIFERANII